MVEVGRHPNITVLTYTDVDRVEGTAGNYKVSLTQKPRYILEDKCTGCTTCVEYCPVKYPDKYNQEISNNKAVHIYFAQSIPLVTYIDESCLYLKNEQCRICEQVCESKAIDLKQLPKKYELEVGAIVLSPGLEPFDPKTKKEYRYGEFANVVTAMDYERLLCSTGPYAGEVLRQSDMTHPHKVAWLQCVGSRKVSEGENSYCSSVCCTYTQKQAMITKEHDAGVDCTIFHNDIRSYGKDFERYYEKTNNLPGTRFIRSYASIVREDPKTKNVTIRYATEGDGVKEEEFDMVVLSVGLTPPHDVQTFAKKFGIELTAHSFCRTNPDNPIATSRPGIFVSGGFQGPVDIPESVFSASGASAQIGELLNARRGKLSREREYPQERDVTKEDERVGVFVCHCGANISRVVDVPDTVEYTKTLPNVVYAQEQIFSCATNSAQEITDKIKEQGLNRVIVAACSPRTLEPLFRDTLREAGLNQYYFEMANIREHDSWVHAKEKDEANDKAKDIIRMSVARARFLQPLQEFTLPVDKAALVIGGGVAGMTTALSLANQGHEVHIIEKQAELGGIARRIHSTLEGMDVQKYLRDLIAKVYKHQKIHVYHSATITQATGYVGNFVTTVQSEIGESEIKHGATIIAIGADIYKPTEYLYGQDDRVLTQLDLEEQIANQDDKIKNAKSIAMIQCVGCRNEERNYCSRVCCSESVKNALKLKEINPQADVYIIYRDMRTYGFREDYYRMASEKDVKFIRYEPQEKPEVQAGKSEDGKDVLKVTLPDYILGQKLELDADFVALAAAVVPSASTDEIAAQYKVTLSPDGFFKEAHVKLKPVEFATDGVYLCGMAHYPKFLNETINQAYGASGRVMTLLSKDVVMASGAVVQVDEKKCIGCSACVSVCAYNALQIRDTRNGKKVAINHVLCKGDGLCNSLCPTGAIQLQHFTDKEVLSEIDAAVTDEEIVQQMDAVMEMAET